MLIEFRVKNFRSIRDEQVLSMEASSQKELPENVMTVNDDTRIVRSAVIYGANAAGKSNIIKALSFMESFIRNSARNNPEDKIPVTPFLFDPETKNQPSEFEITFLHRKVRYQYGFAVTGTSVVSEWLYAYPNGPAQTWYERNNNQPRINFVSREMKGDKRAIESVTRHNHLYLSKAKQAAHEQLSEIYEWFSRHFFVFDNDMARRFLDHQTASMVYKNRKTQRQLAKLICFADTGIDNFYVNEVEESFSNLPEPIRQIILDSRLNEASISMSATVKRYETEFSHPTAIGESVKFDIEDESLGTQRLFGIGGFLLSGLGDGNVIVVDEFDDSLHPLLARYLVQMFHDPLLNANNAQLIFNTHDSTLLDLTLMRRDQIWLVEKDKQGASHLYSILEFSPRSNEALSKGYLQGRYGAIPFLDFEHFRDVINEE